MPESGRYMASGEAILHVRLDAQEAAGMSHARVAAIVYCLFTFAPITWYWFRMP
jgi:hypothetical protein